jgi:hypothetical protein
MVASLSLTSSPISHLTAQAYLAGMFHISYIYTYLFGFFFNMMTSAVTATTGSNIASILLIIMPKSLLFVPGEAGNGFKMLGGD